MAIEELEQELKDLKAYAYDLNNEYAKFSARIDDMVEEIKKLKENENTIQQENSIEMPETVITQSNEVVNESESLDLGTVEESTEVITEPSTVIEETIIQNPEPVFETSPVIEESIVQNTEPVVEIPPVIENTSEGIQAYDNVKLAESVISNPLIQPETEVKNEDVSGAQELNQVSSLPEENIVNTENKKVIIKTDLNAPKAIMVNANQNVKLINSVDESTKSIFGEQQVNEKPRSKEEINEELEAIFEELRTTTEEKKAAELNDKIVVLKKEMGE